MASAWHSWMRCYTLFIFANIAIVMVVNYVIHETWPQFWVRYGVLITVLTVVMLLVMDVLIAIKLWRVKLG